MAMLNESNLLAMKAKAAKFRTNHVGTKLNEAELREFEALAEKRKQTPSELIRGLVLGEIERDKQPPRASVELEEIASLRLLLSRCTQMPEWPPQGYFSAHKSRN